MELQSKVRRFDAESEQLRRSEESLKGQVESLESSLKATTEREAELQREVEATRNQMEEKVLYLQMQLNSAKGRDEVKDKEVAALKRQVESAGTQIASLQLLVEEKEIGVKSNKDVVQALQARLSELEADLEQARAKVRDGDRHHTAQTMLKAEQEALAAALRRDLKSALDGRDEANRRVQELAEYKLKAEGQLQRLGALTDQVNSLQAEVEDRSSLITRLRAEAQASERNHAMKTAMLATCEAQMEALRAELAAKEQTVREAVDRVAALQTRLAVSNLPPIMPSHPYHISFYSKFCQLSNFIATLSSQ
jgi:chromosome segregation ATPase